MYGLMEARIDAERKKLSRAGPKDVNREAELKAPSRVGCSDLLGVVILL
jgi:hypothetical protein